MLDPNHIPLTAEAVGFRVSHGLPVDWGAFSLGLQQQSETIKTRRELKETPVSEVHVMGGQMFGYEGNSLTKTNERQARQMNGYRLRAFTADNGPIVLPSKSSSSLVSAIPIEQGLVQYNRFNAVVGNYVSKMVEPMQAPLENNTILQGRAGYQALSNSATNPYGALKFKMGLDSSLDDMKANQEKHNKKRDREIQNAAAGIPSYKENAEIAKTIRRNITLGLNANPEPVPLHYDRHNPNSIQVPLRADPATILDARQRTFMIPSSQNERYYANLAENEAFIAGQEARAESRIKRIRKEKEAARLSEELPLSGVDLEEYPVSLGPVSKAEREAEKIQRAVNLAMRESEVRLEKRKNRADKYNERFSQSNLALNAVLEEAEAAGETLSEHVNLSVTRDGGDLTQNIMAATTNRELTQLNNGAQIPEAEVSSTPTENYGSTIATPKTADSNKKAPSPIKESIAVTGGDIVTTTDLDGNVKTLQFLKPSSKEVQITATLGNTQTNSNESASGGGSSKIRSSASIVSTRASKMSALLRSPTKEETERNDVLFRKEGVKLGVVSKNEALAELAINKYDKPWTKLSTAEKTAIRKLYDKY